MSTVQDIAKELERMSMGDKGNCRADGLPWHWRSPGVYECVRGHVLEVISEMPETKPPKVWVLTWEDGDVSEIIYGLFWKREDAIERAEYEWRANGNHGIPEWQIQDHRRMNVSYQHMVLWSRGILFRVREETIR